MGRSNRAAVRRYHDRVAHRYDDIYDDDFWIWHDQLTWAYLKPFLPHDQRRPVLDLGCGTGKWAARLAKCGFSVTCVDISPQMLDQARRKLDPYTRSGRVRFIRADLCNLDALESHSFGFALAMGEPIGCAMTPRLVMREIHRVLLPGAVLAATFDNRLAAIDFYLQRDDPDMLGRFLRDGLTHWLTGDRDEQFPIHTFTPAGVRSLFVQAGFDVIELVGKTVLPMRHHRQLLHSGIRRRHWTALEKKLARDPDAVGRASHIQAAGRAQ